MVIVRRLSVPLQGDGEEKRGWGLGEGWELTEIVSFVPGASGIVRIDSSGDREPDYSLKYYVNGSFQNIADYSHKTGGFNLRGWYLYLGILPTSLEGCRLKCKENSDGIIFVELSPCLRYCFADVSVIWAGGRTRPPSDKPRCGWDRELCLEEEKKSKNFVLSLPFKWTSCKICDREV